MKAETKFHEQVEKIASFGGIDVYTIKSSKFKTNTISIFLKDRLNSENVTKNALIPAVLRRGSEKFPTFQEIATYLEDLYGASFDCGVSKKGEFQIMHFYTEYARDEYTGEQGLFQKVFDLLFEVITKPTLYEGSFIGDYVNQEKENIKRIIESRINDKVQYAGDRCLEEMCKDEPYGIYEYGKIEDLQNIDAVNLYSHYLDCLKHLPISIFITGNVSDDKIKYSINRLKDISRGDIKDIGFSYLTKEVTKIKEIDESMNINQAKLSLGFRTKIKPTEESYYSLLVYNNVLGGGMHSKLFRNVREKESLAYYTFSRIEKYKGLMLISSGIDVANKEKTKKIILAQMEDIKNGNISDYEFDSSIKSIITGINSLKDSQIQVVDYYVGQFIGETNDSLDDIILKVGKVTKEDIVKVALKIELDTVYFLKPI